MAPKRFSIRSESFADPPEEVFVYPMTVTSSNMALDYTFEVGLNGSLTGESFIANDEGTILSSHHGIYPNFYQSFEFYSNGTFDYTPFNEWFGEDSFTYQNKDTTGWQNVATVYITVLPV